jgi:hypothetical protein
MSHQVKVLVDGTQVSLGVFKKAGSQKEAGVATGRGVTPTNTQQHNKINSPPRELASLIWWSDPNLECGVVGNQVL